jgi:hypothetical protein
LVIFEVPFCLQSGGLTSLVEVDFIGYSFEPEDRLRKNCNHPRGEVSDAGGEWHR